MSHQDVLTPLVQRLVDLVGLPGTLALVRAIPGLSLDHQGNIVDYDRQDPWHTAQMLIKCYEVAVQKQSTAAMQPDQPDTPAHTPTASLAEPDLETASLNRIMVVDDHALVREGLVGLINAQPDLCVVGEAGSVREALIVARNVRPDLILMDFTLPDGTGDEATRIILANVPHTKIVFLTVHDDDERLLAAIAAGAVGYLLKNIRSSDLLERLRSVLRGDVALSPAIGRRVLEKLSELRATSTPPAPLVRPPAGQELTEREQEILRLIVQGYTNRQIAESLGLSVRTVEYHRANLTGKLGLHTRAELVRYATDHGLV